MKDYNRVPTSAEVWAVIQAAHPEMKVYGSESHHEGNWQENLGKAGVFTSYGFESGDYPVIEAETTWDFNRDDPGQRPNLTFRYWLCLPIKEE